MRRTHQPKRWRMIEADDDAVQRIESELGIHPIVARLLVQRGLTTPEAADLFLNPNLDRMHDPMLLPDAERACERLKQALASGEKIMIHGDYDGDGVTSAALWTRCLRALGADVEVFVPHRDRDGYDMRMKFVEKARQDGVKLIITTDCGIQQCDEVDQACAFGIDVIITDHHTPNADGSLPKAVAVVNPHRKDSQYPFKYLAGVGVALKLCEALTQYLGHSVASFRKSFLDLAAIGTITDVVPLIDENRIIVKHGLRFLKDTRKLGLRALLEACGYSDRTIDAGMISHGVGPRLNAASRIDETVYALDILLTKEPSEATALARKLNELNAKRKEDQARVEEEAFAQIAQLDLAEARCLVLSGDTWPAGIVGLVAGKVVQRLHRPCVAIALDKSGLARASARSIHAFNVLDAIESCKDLLSAYGGHAHAAGLSIASEHVAEFATRMNRIAAASLSDEDCVATLDVAMEIDPTHLTYDLLAQLESLAPFGAANARPLFVSRGVRINEVRCMGKESEHLKLILGIEGLNRWDTVDAPWFYRGDLIQSLGSVDSLDFCYQPNINEFNGKRSIQFIVEDVNAAEW